MIQVFLKRNFANIFVLSCSSYLTKKLLKGDKYSSRLQLIIQFKECLIFNFETLEAKLLIDFVCFPANGELSVKTNPM